MPLRGNPIIEAAEWFRRRMNRSESRVHFGQEDIPLDESARLNAVNVLPEVFTAGEELSFWLDTGYDVYLLMLRDSPERSVEIFPTTAAYSAVCVTVQMPLAGRRFDRTVINELLVILRMAGYPGIPNRKSIWKSSSK